MTPPLASRIAALDWTAIGRGIDEWGHARTPPVVTPDECGALVALYADERRFRSRIDMARHRFGLGEYKYFAHPLPPIVRTLRREIYPRLVPLANRWMAALGMKNRHPPDLDGFLALCHKHGQTKPTPLLLRYEAGGYNCLHQDIYGEVAFPLQVLCALSVRGADYTGGEFLLVEQRPRSQSRGEVIAVEQGELVIFTTRYRPVWGARGHFRVNIRHGVSRLTSGTRYTLGVIFHDAK